MNLGRELGPGRDNRLRKLVDARSLLISIFPVFSVIAVIKAGVNGNSNQPIWFRSTGMVG
jgi:hypothetical protein